MANRRTHADTNDKFIQSLYLIIYINEIIHTHHFHARDKTTFLFNDSFANILKA